MSAESQTSFNCTDCGRQYAWKLQLAGKKVKCKCGHTMVVPPGLPEDELGLAVPPPAPEAAVSPEPDLSLSVPCPACGQELAAGSVLCVNCGYNLETGQRLGTQLEVDALPAAAPAEVAAPRVAPSQRVAAAGRAAPALNPYPTRKHTVTPEEKEGGKGKLIGTAVAVVVILGGLAVTAKMMSGTNDNFPPAVAGDDTAILKQMRDTGTIEAREFLAGHTSRSIGQMVRHKAEGWIDSFYRMGAKEVRAFVGVISASVIVIMPDDPESRKKLIESKNRLERESGVLPDKLTKDVGQRYLKFEAGW